MRKHAEAKSGNTYIVNVREIEGIKEGQILDLDRKTLSDFIVLGKILKRGYWEPFQGTMEVETL